MTQHLKVCCTFISQFFLFTAYTNSLSWLTDNQCQLAHWHRPPHFTGSSVTLLYSHLQSIQLIKGFTPLWYISVDGGWYEYGPWRNMANCWTTTHIHLHQSTSEFPGKTKKQSNTHARTHARTHTHAHAHIYFAKGIYHVVCRQQQFLRNLHISIFVVCLFICLFVCLFDKFVSVSTADTRSFLFGKYSNFLNRFTTSRETNTWEERSRQCSNSSRSR